MPDRARSSNRQGFSRSTQRRQTSWTSGPQGQVTRTTSGSTLFPLGLVPLLEGLTITRMRGELLVFLTSADGVNTGYDGAVGIGLVSDEAFAAGVASMPTPIDDIDYEEWIWFQLFHARAPLAITAAASVVGPAFGRYSIDNKAMRKFPVGKTLVAVLEVTEVASAGITAVLDVRTLVTLP